MPYHMLLIYQYAKNPTSILFKDYLGQTGPGNHHDNMLSASTYLYHEGFSEEEIEEICYAEARRSASDNENYENRCKEIRIAVKKLAARNPERKPSSTKSAAAAGKAKMSPDRFICNWLLEKHGGNENVGIFDGITYNWDGTRWQMMIELNHPKGQWGALYRDVCNEFPTISSGIVGAGVGLFTTLIRVREAAPDMNYIPFKNGMLDVHAMQLRPQEREDYILHTLDADYDATAKCPLWDKFIWDLMMPPRELQQDPENDRSQPDRSDKRSRGVFRLLPSAQPRAAEDALHHRQAEYGQVGHV